MLSFVHCDVLKLWKQMHNEQYQQIIYRHIVQVLDVNTGAMWLKYQHLLVTFRKKLLIMTEAQDVCVVDLFFVFFRQNNKPYR
jgi:hypothetical protein